MRLRALPDVSGVTLRAFVTDAVAAAAIVPTDGWQGYRPLGKAGYDHHRRSQRAAGPDEDPILDRAHRAISNLKLWLAGTHRGVSNEHIQVYLDEFVFRHNRRHTPLAAFQTLLSLSASHAPTTHDQITRRAA